ncbi:MAG: cellulase family glycosylhydrolase [Fibrobacteres bacterium]|nr:cellulase family glycosylhydrolase [Fibrobacterota bacterium]
MVKNIILTIIMLHMSVFAYDTLLVDDFNNYTKTKTLFGDTAGYRITTEGSFEGSCIKLTSVDSNAYIVAALPVSIYAGKRIELSAMFKGLNISKQHSYYAAINFMIVQRRKGGSLLHTSAAFLPGDTTFDWRRNGFQLAIRPDIEELHLVLSLQNLAGTLYVDNLVIRLLSDFMQPPRDAQIPINTETAFRGGTVTHNPDRPYLQLFGKEWKVNIIRWWINFDSNFSAQLDRIDSILPHCKTNGIKMLLVNGGLTGGYFKDSANQAIFISRWKTIAERLKGNDAIWGYDLANEPDHASFLPDKVKWWDDLAETTAVEIRKIDPATPIIVEPRYGDPGELGFFRPLNASISNVVYSMHHYLPHTLTHQGIPQSIGNYPPFGAVYPGTIDGINWDTAQMRIALEPTRAFQLRYRVPIYVGEFSCIRWAAGNSALKWLTDAINLFEEYGWDWTYHSLHDYDGWSVEYNETFGDNTFPVETARKALLLSYFAKNKNPYSGTGISELKIDDFKNDLNCFPNPFNPSVTIIVNKNLSLPFKMEIYDVSGKKVVDLTKQLKNGKIVWHAGAFPSGCYCVKITGKYFNKSVKVMLLK